MCRVEDKKRDVLLTVKVIKANPVEEPTIFKQFQRESGALDKIVHQISTSTAVTCERDVSPTLNKLVISGGGR